MAAAAVSDTGSPRSERDRPEVATPAATTEPLAANDAELSTAEAIAAEIRASGILDSGRFYDADDASEVVYRHLADDGHDVFADRFVAERVSETVDLLLDPDIVTLDNRGAPLLCGDCGRRVAYDYFRDAYRHLVDDHRGCLVIRAETDVDLSVPGTIGSASGRPDDPARPVLRRRGERVRAQRDWVSVPARRNRRGEDFEVLYDPQRYDVLVVHGEPGGMFPRLAHEASADLMLDTLAITGWEPHNIGLETRVWIRDRAAAERLVSEHREAGKQPEVQFNDVGPTRPFLRPDGSTWPIPPGWIAEPAGVAGTSNDVPVEVVYNPQRHDVMRVPHARTRAVLALLADQGWTPASTDSTSHLLWRDRIAHARTTLERSAAPPAAGIEGPEL